MVNDNFPVPDSITNYPHLRTQALSRIDTPANTPLDVREQMLVAQLLGQMYPGSPVEQVQGFSHVLEHLLKTSQLQRFNALDDLLNPHNGYLSAFPVPIARLARYLLDWKGAKAAEEAKFDWKGLHERYPHLF